MPTQKARLAKSLDVLTKEVADITDLAKRQRNDADNQHQNAHNLEVIGGVLKENAVLLREELSKI